MNLLALLPLALLVLGLVASSVAVLVYVHRANAELERHADLDQAARP